MSKRLLVLIVIFGMLCPVFVNAQGINFFGGSYDEAVAKAKRENKSLLIYFTAKWCGPCRHMDKYIFTDPEVAGLADKFYVPVKFDVDERKSMEYYVQYTGTDRVSVPIFVVASPEEKILRKRNGSMKLSQFKEFLASGKNAEAVAQVKEVAKNVEGKSASSGFGGFVYNCKNSRWKPGLRLGINVSGVRTKNSLDVVDLRAGFLGGVFFDYTGKRFSFQPGINFTAKGAEDSDTKLRLNYLEVPLKFSLNILKHRIVGCPQAVRLDINPYGAYALGGKIRDDHGEHSVKFGSGDDKARRFDYGLKTGLSLRMGSFEPSLGYDIGVRDVLTGKGEWYNRGFYFNMAVVIGK
ncbi:hypothetical protein FUAX_03340 [Fulvitalea axinellae]|uniref:Outer membrane protein beta-barrel domain-containing protein n=1 Tax=Fulvitalea axinellae TaxID=1182444 RepID=A0AAU9CJ65_9BACT|nr:hypothetical protein FUAX_03340 [Fulvitalea axinellae]